MMKKITFLMILLTVSFGFSQDLLLGFEDAESGGLDGGPFGNGNALQVNIVTDGGTNGTKVAEFIANSAGEIWQGINMNLTTNVDLISTQTMTMDVKSATAITFLVKVNDGTGPEAAAAVTHNGDNTWQTLSFTFNTSLDGKAAMANGNYNGFVVHAYWSPGATTFGEVTADERTFYIDNISGPVAGPDPEPSEAAPTPPARAAADVKSIFSDAYTPIATLNYAGVDGQPSNDNTYNTSWCPATTELVQIAGNNTNKVTGLGCEGVSFLSARFDATSFTHFHIDIWTDSDTQDKSFNMKFSNWDGGAGEVNAIQFSTTNASNPALPNPNPGTWISLDIPLTDWTAGNRNDLVQFIITSDLGAVYYDNLYLHKNTTLGTEDFAKTSFKTYPNPTQDKWTIETQNVRMSSITVYDVLGKSVMAIEPNEDRAVIDGSNLKSGLYFAKVETAEGVSSVKLVKK